MGTILLAGIYGVGKSTLAQKLSLATQIPFYSAGDLISSQNGEQYGANKYVANKEMNQDILVGCVSDLLKIQSRIILAGHFCIINDSYQIDPLPNSVFDQLQIERIILLESAPLVIQSHLSSRDNKVYSNHLIGSMLEAEHSSAQEVAQRLSIPFLVHQMSYSDVDVLTLVHFIE